MKNGLSFKNRIIENTSYGRFKTFAKPVKYIRKKTYNKRMSSASIQQIEHIQKKKYINVKEFTLIYGFSSEWQRNRRKRLRDKLPTMQQGLGHKILYDIEKIELWFINNNLR